MGSSNEMASLPEEFRDFSGSVEVVCQFAENTAVASFIRSINGQQTGNEISFRRSIQSQRIEYFVNGSSVERLYVKNFLQTFGFSDSYPFRCCIFTTDISTVDASNVGDRVHWLKDCCGVGDYCAKRDKSKRVLKETEEQIAKIDSALAKIDVQLEICSSDETQQIYEAYVRRERELGHFQRLYRMKKLRAEIETQESEMNACSVKIECNKREMIQNTDNCRHTRRQIKWISDQLNASIAKQHENQAAKGEWERREVTLKASIRDIQNKIEQGAWAEELSAHEMGLYRDKIDETSSQISGIDEQIERFAEEKQAIDQEIYALDSGIESIVQNCQQNQRLGTWFKSVDKRNEHLVTQIKRSKNAIGRENRKFKSLQVEVERETGELNNLQRNLAQHNQQLAEMNADDEINSIHEHQQLINDLEFQRQ